MPPLREYGTGGISWIGPTKVQLRIWVPTENDRRRETKVVKVPDREHGGRGKAKEELEKFIAEVAQRASVPTGPTVTVAEMLDAYLVHCKRIGSTQSTIESYEHATRRVPATLGALPLAKLTSRDLDAFCGDLAERLADNTIRQTHAILTAALEQAMKWGWIKDNPAKGATAPGRHKPKRSALPLPDIAKMVAIGEPVEVCSLPAYNAVCVFGRALGTVTDGDNPTDHQVLHSMAVEDLD
jgi:hypothetical protein